MNTQTQLKIILASLYFQEKPFAIRGYRIFEKEEKSLAQHIADNHSIKFANVTAEIKNLIEIGVFKEVENKEDILTEKWDKNNYYVKVEYIKKRTLRLYKNKIYTEEQKNLYQMYINRGEDRKLALQIIQGYLTEFQEKNNQQLITNN